MIDRDVFRASRDLARSRLSVEEAKESFGYYIDLINCWENYRCPESLINWFGIHSTHIPHFPELVHNLGELSSEEMDLAGRYAAFCDAASKFLSSTGFRTDLRYDIAETMTDWRNIRKYVDLPARILDFGAGCARQGVWAYMQNPANTYVAIDGSLIGYTMQNLVFSVMDMIGADRGGRDFLDLEVAGTPFPSLADARPGERYHVPVWLLEDNLPKRYFDLIIGSHIAFELSKPDFMRFMRSVINGLSDDGVLYLRSEISSPDYRDYFDALDLHGSNIVEILGTADIVPISCEYDTFLTTVFARRGSKPHKAALARSETAEELLKARRNMDLSLGAGARHLKRRLKELISNNYRVAVFGSGYGVDQQMVAPVLKDLTVAPLLERTGDLDPDRVARVRDYDPDVLVIAGGDLGAQETALRSIWGEGAVFLRFHQIMPVIILLRDRLIRPSAMFDHPIRSAADVPPARKIGVHEIFPTLPAQSSNGASNEGVRS